MHIENVCKCKCPITPTDEQTNEWTTGRHVAPLGRFLIMIPIHKSNFTPLFICVPRNQFCNVFSYGLFLASIIRKFIQHLYNISHRETDYS